MVDFDRLTSKTLWERVVYVLAGYVLATTAENFAGARTDMNIPAEAYGVASVLVAEMAMSGKMRTYTQIGAGYHTVESLLERLEVKGTVLGFGGN